MKKIIYSLFALSMLITINSCKKTGNDANVFSSVGNFGTGAYLVLDSTINVNFNSTQLATSTVGIQVSQAPAGEAISSITLYVSLSAGYDTTKWSKIKSIPYSGPKTTVSATGTDLAKALNIPLEKFAPGSNYSFFTRVYTKSGKFYDASNTGNDAGTGLVTGPTYHTAFVFTAYITCPFVAPIAGNYAVVRDDWADYGVGDVVHVKDGPGTNEVDLSEVYPNPAYGDLVNPLVVDVDPATGTASVKKVNFGNYGAGYNMVAEGHNGNDVAGYVFSCTGYITLTMDFSNTTGTSFGPITLILQKLPDTETAKKANAAVIRRSKF